MNFAPSQETRDVVYFLYDETSNRMKIGTTGNLRRRMCGIQATSPSKLKLYFTIPGSVEREREIHAQVAAYRVHHEWFACEPGFNRVVNALALEELRRSAAL